MTKKTKKTKKKEYPYEKYAKYWLHAKGIYSKELWDEFTDEERREEYKEAKFGYYFIWAFCIFIVLLIAGGIIYGIGADDVLNGILIALGFPLFIIAGFFGAGKGI